MPASATLFRYKCPACGVTGPLQIRNDRAICPRCGRAFRLSPAGVITFTQLKTAQNVYFDQMYQAGQSHASLDFLNEYEATPTRQFAEDYLGACGFDLDRPVEHLSLLDLACGSGWITAGLLQNSNVRNCRFHAFDLSPQGPELLARYARNLKSSNSLEISVQDAEAMVFENGSFDVIIGASVLHHFDAVEDFLGNCFRLLKPGGVATFGEPFAIGYALGAACLVLAQKQLGTTYPAIETFYTDIATRITKPRESLKSLVDKHLFFQFSFAALAQQIGFNRVEFIPLANREYYRDYFINELLVEKQVADPRLKETANGIYRIFFDLFDAESYANSLAAFLRLVLWR